MGAQLIAGTHPQAIAQALAILEEGGVVAFPTDTVYGVGANLFDEEAVSRLYQVKGRSQTKAIAILLHDVDQLTRVAATVPDAARRIGQAFWPGPLTLIVPRHPAVPEMVSQYPTIGVRIPDHPLALALLKTAPLAVTSANLSGGENTETAQQVLTQLGSRIDLILDGGRTPGGVPSSVVDMTTAQPKILRPGPITLADIQAVLNIVSHDDEC